MVALNIPVVCKIPDGGDDCLEKDAEYIVEDILEGITDTPYVTAIKKGTNKRTISYYWRFDTMDGDFKSIVENHLKRVVL